MAGPMAEQEPQAHAELATFGEELRREREIRGISLKEISDDTKISKRFLEAIERNDHKTLPAPVFTRGFVRQYALYLGLNAEEMVTRYNYAAAGDDRIEKSEHLQRLVSPQPAAGASGQSRREQPRRSIPPAYARIDKSVYLVAMLVIALGGVTYWAMHHKRADNDARAEVVATTQTPAAVPTTHAAVAATAPPATTSSAPANADVLQLTLELSDDSWITLEADGKTVFSDEMKSGEHHTFEAKDRFRFKTIGNAAGVTITINDHKFPALGREGQVLHDRVFDRASLSSGEPSVLPRSQS